MISALNNQAAPTHVAEAFAHYARFIAAKEQIPLPRLGYHVATGVALPGGATATLWVAAAETAKSTCYHMAVSRAGSQNAMGTGACGTPDDQLSLDRTGALVVGSVGNHPAETVRLTTAHGEATVIVDTGYFLVPPELTPEPGVLHTVEMFGLAGEMIGRVTDVRAPGSAPLVKP